MADNVRITSKANSTPPDGTVIATDQVGTSHYQRFKLDVGGDGVSLPVQASTDGNLVTLSHMEHEIHSGNHYYISGHVTLSATSGHYVKLTTPATGDFHFRWDINSNGILETNLWEGSTGGMAGGAGVTPLNNDRNSTGASALTITSGVAVATSKGTKVDSSKVGGTGFKTTVGGRADRDDEIILKNDVNYFREFLSGSDDNVVSFRAMWIEE